MDKSDRERLIDLLTEAWILKGRPAEQVTMPLVNAWLNTLPDIPLGYVERALQLHARDAQYKHPPTPADVLEIIRERTQAQWPSADEAWSIALQAMDEDNTVVWCEEIARAWDISRPIAEADDDVGARMAFRESYKRLVREARDAGGEPRWETSLGHNPMLREAPLLRAVKDGRLTQDGIKHLLPAPPPEPGSVMAMLTGPKSNGEAFSISEVLGALKESLLKEEEPVPDPLKEAEIERRRRAAAAMLKKTEKREP